MKAQECRWCDRVFHLTGGTEAQNMHDYALLVRHELEHLEVDERQAA